MIVPSEMPEALLDTDTLSLCRRAHAQVTRHAAAYIRRYGQLTFAELTRLTDFSMSPCPEVIFGALGRLTQNIHLGFGVVILP